MNPMHQRQRKRGEIKIWVYRVILPYQKIPHCVYSLTQLKISFQFMKLFGGWFKHLVEVEALGRCLGSRCRSMFGSTFPTIRRINQLPDPLHADL